MARRRKGSLSEDDAAVWQQVARTARPLHQPLSGPLHVPEAAPKVPMAAPVPAPLPAFRVGAAADARRGHDLAPPVAEWLRAAGLRMDKRVFDRMKRGKLVPEARIDLHGMTLAEAHPALIRFVLSAHGRGLRLVLVITGKGKPAAGHDPVPVRSGALRQQVPHWLHLAPVGPLVQQVAPAHVRHGGGGAYYVYLRRGG